MIDKQQLFQNLNSGMLNERFYAFRNNVKRNRATIELKGGVASLLPVLSNKHVIIVGAGPTLETNLDTLYKYNQMHDFFIIATDMATRPLVKHGIVPHFVFSCETTPVGFFHSFATNNSHLLAFSCMSHVHLRSWQGNVSFYNWMMDGECYNELWDIAGRDLGYVATGSIITTQAIAFVLGCNVASVMLVGNDLGFQDRYYARETVVYQRNCLRTSRLQSMETKEMDLVQSKKEFKICRGDRSYYTNNQFLAAKMWLEELIQKHSLNIFDCSLPGLSERYVQKIALGEYFKIFERPKRKRRRKK